jgi:TnpA family transposase
MSKHQRRALVRELRNEVSRCADREQLLVRARQWLYEHRLLIVHNRAIRTLIAAALTQFEAEMGAAIRTAVQQATRERWYALVAELRSDGQTQQRARGDPIYEAGVQLGRLLRTTFLADYFVNTAFRQELRRVLNRGEAVNALKRAIYTGRVSPAQAKRVDEMQAVADALSLLANIVMTWNTAQMQAILDRWANRRQVVPPKFIGKIAPTRLEGINLRGVFRYPIERYADQILPSRNITKTTAIR